MTIEPKDLDEIYHLIIFLASGEKGRKDLVKNLETLQNEVVKLYKKLGSNPPASSYDEF
jgi:uncharacterized protein YhaN